jgi:hypothetical protein
MRVCTIGKMQVSVNEEQNLIYGKRFIYTVRAEKSAFRTEADPKHETLRRVADVLFEYPSTARN